MFQDLAAPWVKMRCLIISSIIVLKSSYYSFEFIWKQSSSSSSCLVLPNHMFCTRNLLSLNNPSKSNEQVYITTESCTYCHFIHHWDYIFLIYSVSSFIRIQLLKWLEIVYRMFCFIDIVRGKMTECTGVTTETVFKQWKNVLYIKSRKTRRRVRMKGMKKWIWIGREGSEKSRLFSIRSKIKPGKIKSWMKRIRERGGSEGDR